MVVTKTLIARYTAVPSVERKFRIVVIDGICRVILPNYASPEHDIIVVDGFPIEFECTGEVRIIREQA
jgi:hypothetical protein